MTMAHLCGHDCERICGNEADLLRVRLSASQRREQELTNALREIAEMHPIDHALRVGDVARAALAPAVEERCMARHGMTYCNLAVGHATPHEYDPAVEEQR